jgi:hypothetical protein
MNEDKRSIKKDRNLKYLNELSDYTVSDNDKDVRGWPVKDVNDTTIGEVDNLLVSRANNRVVYLVVEMDESILKENHPYSTSTNDDSTNELVNEEGEDHVIVPIGMAHLDLDNEIVHTPKINWDIFARTQRIKKGSLIDRHYETNVLESYDRSVNATFTDTERTAEDTTLYDRPEYTKENQGSKGVY